jgi:hypothetical protein
MATVYKEIEIDVDLGDYQDYDLIEELERRGKGLEVGANSSTDLLTSIYEKRRLGKDYQQELDELIYQNIGRIL